MTSNTQTIEIPDPFDAASPGTRLRLLSYNIQVGIGAKRFRDYVTDSWKHVLPHAQVYDNLSRIAQAIRDFDIVASSDTALPGETEVQDLAYRGFRLLGKGKRLVEPAVFEHWLHRLPD